MTRAIAVFNGGSSSLKFTLYGAQTLDVLARASVEELHTQPRAVWHPAGQAHPPEAVGIAPGFAAALGFLQQHLASTDVQLAVAGHRVVHGGTQFTTPVQVTPEVLAGLETLVPLAPLHQPHNLAVMRELAALYPDLPQIACFDTAFHTTQLPLASWLPLSRDLHQQGVRRYGFHGLSYQSIAERLPDYTSLADGRVIAVHLGSGASACAMLKGRSQASSMGMTALDGLMMGTRPGCLDPGVLLYLLEHGATLESLTDLLYRKSGLLGVSGISADMRVLLASAAPEAAEAVELFCFLAARQIAGLIPALGGLDVLVFTGAMGANSRDVRARICGYLGWLGLRLDHAANHHASHPRLSAADSAVVVLALPTDEEGVMARACQMMIEWESSGM
jgi:acetate kinase